MDKYIKVETELRRKYLKLAEKVRDWIPTKVLVHAQVKYLYRPTIADRRLSSAVPELKVVMMELRSRCNATCSFCPVNIKDDIRDDITMPFEVFKKAINDLVDLNFSGRLAFFNNSEPLITPNLLEYISYATKQLSDVQTFQISTNGLSLTEKLGSGILEAGINLVTINVYNDNFGSELPSKVQRFRELVGEFNKRNSKPVRLLITRRGNSSILDNRAGDAPNKKDPQSMKYRGFCINPFVQFCINPNGTVSLCCYDAYATKIMGDITKDSIREIWGSKIFEHYRKNLLEGNRGMLDVCLDCDYYGITNYPRGLRNNIIRALTN